jgi:hypothetical protein
MNNLKEKTKETLDMLGIFVLAGVLTFFIGHYYNQAMHGLGNDKESVVHIEIEKKISKSIEIKDTLAKESE